MVESWLCYLAHNEATCFSLLVQRTHNDWKPGNRPQQVRTILGHALSSGISDARQLASEVIHRLGVQGENSQD